MCKYSILLLLSLAGCSRPSSPQHITTKFVLLRDTDSGFYPFGDTVDSTLISHNCYRRLTYADSLLIKIEQFDTSGHLVDDIYSPAVVVFTYGSATRPDSLAQFDKEGQKVINGFRGYWSIRYKYDGLGRIVEKRYYDTSGVLFKVPRDSVGVAHEGDYQPPIVHYRYLDSRITETTFDENGVELGTKEINKMPCVIFLDCPEH